MSATHPASTDTEGCIGPEHAIEAAPADGPNQTETTSVMADLRRIRPRLQAFDGVPLLSGDTDTVFIAPWRQPLADTLGHDSRGPYVERFWLPVLGPSATWLIRTIGWGLAAQPDGYLVDLSAVARTMGVSERLGRSSTMHRALTRLCQFDLATVHDEHPSGTPMLHARSVIPWLSRRLVLTLPSFLREEHETWYQRAHPHRVGVQRTNVATDSPTYTHVSVVR
jgi:hypothetical protein